MLFSAIPTSSSDALGCFQLKFSYILAIIWDIATEKSLNSFRNHTDYVRAGAINPASENVILSGGYDSEWPIIL